MGTSIDQRDETSHGKTDREGCLIGCVETAEPSTKKIKLKQESSSSGRVPVRFVHPFGIKPIGNYYQDAIKGIQDCRACGLGRFLCFSDELMLNWLNWLEPTDLCLLSVCSRACYVFASHDELWRTLVLEEMKGDFKPEKTWKQSYITTKSHDKFTKLHPIRISGFYSDILFQAFHCASTSIHPSWIAVDNVDRRSALEMTPAQFKDEYEIPNKPVVITDAMTDWSALTKWTDEYLINMSANQTFSAGDFQFSMAQYLHYSRTLLDDQPLFIFDKQAFTNVSQLAQDYHVPSYFTNDFFEWLIPPYRPDHRWLIIGPKKSGSSFHIDPNSTNAWNAVIRGAKKWILFPPDIIPPGVHPSHDHGDVSTPVSLIEWFISFYSFIHKLPPEQRPIEGICKAGEMMFVPNGWWHLVLNIEESIAITQNYTSHGNVKNVIRFLEEKQDQVSGVDPNVQPLLGMKFRQVLAQNEPKLLETIETELKQEYDLKHRKSKWEMLVQKEQTTQEFSFGFSF